MSQQALSKARSKFDHTPFLKLFTGIRDAFYGKAYLETLRKYGAEEIATAIQCKLDSVSEFFGDLISDMWE